MANREERFLDSEKAPTVYVNSVQLGLSTFDIRIRMGVMEEATPELIVTRVVTNVYMSPQHAKVFADLLNGQLAKYEAMHGPIVLPRPPAENPPAS